MYAIFDTGKREIQFNFMSARTESNSLGRVQSDQRWHVIIYDSHYLEFRRVWSAVTKL